MSSTALMNKAPAQWLANAFKEVDWPIPPYLTMGFLGQTAKAVHDAPQDQKLEIMRHAMHRAYDREYLAGMFLERYSKIVHVRDFSRQIDEAIKAYFSGYKFVAVTALITVFEGIIRKIAKRQSRDIGHGTKKLNEELDALVEKERTAPYCYGERLVMLEAFRDFVRDRLLEKTDRYTGLNEFNRHGIVHAIFEKFGEDINFFRLITLLDLLCFSIGLLGERISMFGPPPTAESSKLAAHYLWLQTEIAHL